MVSADSSSIIGRLNLNNSDYRGFYSQVSIFLEPFAFLIPLDSYDPAMNGKNENTGKRNTQKNKKVKKTGNEFNDKEVRPIAKQYFSFLVETNKQLPSVIQKYGKERKEEDENVTELLCVYKLVLDCFQCILPCLAGKFYKMHLYRSKLVWCLEVCGKYEEAETMALSLLESLVPLVNSETTVVKSVGKRKVIKTSSGFLPVFIGAAVDYYDHDVVLLFVEIVKQVIRCAYKKKVKDTNSYCQVIAMVEELQPWLNILDTDVCVKYRSSLANDLYNCAMTFTTNSTYFDVNLVQQFCRITLHECLKSSLRDHLPKIIRRICLSFDLQWEDRYLVMLDMLKFYIESILCNCEVDEVNIEDGFFEYFCYCAEVFSNSNNVDVSKATFMLLSNAESHYVKVSPTVASIMNLYASGLCFAACNTQTNHSGNSDDGSIFSCLLDSKKCLLCLSKSLDFLKHNNKIYVHERKIELSTLQVSKMNAVFFSCFNALVFACKLLAEHVNIAWKDTSSQENIIHCSLDIPHIQDIFLQFNDLYFQMDRSIELSVKQKEKLKESRGSLLKSAIASLRIFFKTERNKEKTVTWIDDLISSKWIEPKDLKFLSSSLYNTGATLYYMKQIEKASVAFRLTFTAEWVRVKLLCQIFTNESKTARNVGLSEESFKDVIADACLKSAAIFDVLYQCHDVNVLDLIVDSLLSWVEAKGILKSVINPKDLVKAWVKVVRKGFKEGVEADDLPLLYSFLLKHIKLFSKETIGIIIEQEFFAYGEIFIHSPNICQAMQQKIINILLHDVYVTKEYFLQRAKIFILKGKTFRVRSSGLDGLNNCIQCLSEAIILLDRPSWDPAQKKISHHLLAFTYCLHALCAHETHQDLEVILHDIRSAIDLWFNLDLQSYSTDDQFDLVNGNTLYLLFNVYDLMSLKGVLEFQTKIYKLIIILWKLKSGSLESYIAMLWSDRRFNHLLCPLVVNADTINNISHHFDVDANSFNIWFNSLKDMPSASLGFVQKLIISDSITPQVGSRNPQKLNYKVTPEEVDATASTLSSTVPLASHSAFSAAYLYYDLSERVSLDGRFYEALQYAKKALVLRKKILLRKFIYLSKQQHENKDDVVIEAIGSVVTEVWPHTHKSLNLEQTYVNPWNVLKCYLESTLQVAFIHEKIGEGDEAEYYLKIGKSISVSSKLHFCEALFACHLGKVYCKKQQYDLSKNELESVESILNKNEMVISCKYCKLSLEVIVDMRKGDLSRCLSKSGSHCQSTTLPLYKSALEKLSNVNLEIPQTFYDRRIVNCSLNDFHYVPPKKSSIVKLNEECDKINTNKVACKRVKNSSRTLRSNKELSDKTPVQSATSQDHDHPSCSEILDISNEGNCSLERSNCLECYLTGVAEANSMLDMIYQKWECHRRRLLLKLLSRIGSCTNVCNGIHDIHKCFLQSMSLLFMRDPYRPKHSTSSYPFFTKLIEKECSGDIFTIERAVILHDMSVFFVKNYLSENSRIHCCYLSNIQLSTVLSWLLRAFMLTCDFPLLFQKISQLLATLFLLSSLGGNYSITDYFKSSLSTSHWAAYFHQASLGTSLHHKHFSIFKERTCSSMNFIFPESAKIINNSSTFFRIIPEKLVQLEEFVKNFFTSLPSLSIVCVTFLEGDYINVLGEALLLTSFVPAWLFLSRFNSDGQPIVILLPVDSVHEEFQDDENSHSGSGKESEVKESAREWKCPWKHSVFDDVVPHFKSILRENYCSMSNVVSNSKWWTERKKLDNRFGIFLRCIENLWLGPWRCLFLGERSYPKCFDKLMIALSDLNCKSKFDINENLLKVIIGGSSSLADAEECFHQLFLYGGYFGRGECAGEGRFRAFSTTSNSGEQSMFPAASFQLITEIFNIIHENSVDRGPIILVLDADIQMLPWENLPVLRNEEVYRMPSVGSILMTLNGRNYNKGIDMAKSIFPLVDTMNTYYLVNPSGDFTSTQVEFEEWFRGQKWEGKAGSVPAVEELSTALQNNDLYIYFDHGSGSKYISAREIGKMKKCAACFLMGCGSGCFFLNGCYTPDGPSLPFLFAGSPVVIGNLWEVSDKDIDRFSKAMVNSWVDYSNPQLCTCIGNVKQKMKYMEIDAEKPPKNSRKTRNRVTTIVKSNDKDDQRNKCPYCILKNKKNRITSFMSQARDSCRLPYLNGASPVCYGVPTIIKNTINLD